jgi:hypothetical protein
MGDIKVQKHGLASIFEVHVPPWGPGLNLLMLML